jgi:hypothetical protein
LTNEAKRFLAGGVLSGTDSISVFQAWQLGHLPSHLGLTPPQSEQTKTVFSFAMAAMVMHARIQSARPVRDRAQAPPMPEPAVAQGVEQPSIEDRLKRGGLLSFWVIPGVQGKAPWTSL